MMRPSSDKNMSLSGHLRELRRRILICMVSLVCFFLIGLRFAPAIIDHLTGLGEKYGYSYVFIAPQELLMQYFSIAMLFGLIFSVPVLLYHTWAFIQPGLRENENTLFLGALFSGLCCFCLGVLFAYKIMFPFMLHFLIQLSHGSKITAAISVQNYMSFLLSIFLIFGIVFEMPVICILLTSMGLLRVEWLKKARKIIIVAIFFVAAVITPPDIVSQIMTAFPMIALFEISIVLCSVIQSRKKDRSAE